MDNFLTPKGMEGYFFIFTKGFFILSSILYLVFALIVVKQVTSMSKSVTDKFNPILVIFSYLHLGFSIFLTLTMFGL
ncbi:MAG: hypothetical protein PHO75_00035 [Candidatus Shapirobacteria bacterium]|jgi:hypothetical protein|nr:hypothetical protein [Candidatus Shapirobacteria bacterium]